MELLLLGVVGQVVALRLLALQLARSPEDPPLVRHRVRTASDVSRRRRRHRRLVRTAVAGFVAATLVSAAGLALLLR
jgi:hypothetical protein